MKNKLKLVKFNKYYIIALIVIFILGVSTTYSYYAYSYEDSVAIKGNVIAIDADLTVELVVGNNGQMVPLKDSSLSNALNAVDTTNGACVDKYGNLACQVYKITLHNNGSRLQNIKGTIELYAKDSSSTYTNLKWRELTNTTTIKNGSIINGMDKSNLVTNLTLDSGEEAVYYIAVYIQEVNTDQKNNDKGEFQGTVTFETGDGASVSSPTAIDKIIDLYNDGSSINTVNIGGSTSNPEVHLNATQGIMLDNNGDYRYYGANPNNYVTFNDETWRIIGAFNNVDDGTGNKETRLKIIRDESIGNYSWDSSASTVNSGNGVNDWSKADLMTELNTLYYNSTSGTCYNGRNNASTTCNFTSTGLDSTARSMIDDAVYRLGGSSRTSTSGLYADDYYNAERGTTVYSCSTDDGACPRATTWTGKVGLMYPSDYAYAVDLSLCTQNGYNYDNSTCKSNDWLLYSSVQLTIMPRSSYAYYAFNVNSTGRVYDYLVYISYAARPVLYLKSDVTIVEGEGTSSNPYQLG